uniref:G-protein coupled receptors family 1 profile domain-containing protein n=1 Tax=Ascaris lumbricoides TaxID=6252 RepID=A0A9J2PG58_ASCLU
MFRRSRLTFARVVALTTGSTNRAPEVLSRLLVAELDAAIAVMALLGILSGRRFVFCFTALFFVLHTLLTLSMCSRNLYSLLHRYPIWSQQCYDEAKIDGIYWCRLVDTLYFFSNCMIAGVLTMITTTVCFRLLYVVSNKKQLPTHVVADRRPIIREPYPQLIPLHKTSQQNSIQ